MTAPIVDDLTRKPVPAAELADEVFFDSGDERAAWWAQRPSLSLERRKHGHNFVANVGQLWERLREFGESHA